MCYTSKCGNHCHTGKIMVDLGNNISATATDRNGALGQCLECGVRAYFIAGGCD